MAEKQLAKSRRPTPVAARRKPERSKLAEGIGLAAGIVALAAGGVAAGLELERRIVSKRVRARTVEIDEPFFGLRAQGPMVTTPDGVILHTEIDEVPAGIDPEFAGTIVFVHGYALSLDCWHFQRKYFRGRARLVLYDQRSHGRSGRSEPGLCRVPQLAEDLAQIMEEVVGQGPVMLIGHSMGGMTIMELARTRPEWFGDRIVGVGLMSTSAGDLADHSPIKGLPGRTFSRIAEPLMATLNRIPELVERGRKAGSDIGYVVTRRMSFGSPVPVSYVEFMSEMLGATPLEVVADYYPAFGELDETEAFAVLARVECAVFGGEDDVITPVQHTERIIELLPSADALIQPNSGHMGIIEHHKQVNALLDGLLTRVRRNLAA